MGGVWVYEEHPEAEFEACCQPEPLYLKLGVVNFSVDESVLISHQPGPSSALLPFSWWGGPLLK